MFSSASWTSHCKLSWPKFIHHSSKINHNFQTYITVYFVPNYSTLAHSAFEIWCFCINKWNSTFLIVMLCANTNHYSNTGLKDIHGCTHINVTMHPSIYIKQHIALHHAVCIIPCDLKRLAISDSLWLNSSPCIKHHVTGTVYTRHHTTSICTYLIPQYWTMGCLYQTPCDWANICVRHQMAQQEAVCNIPRGQTRGCIY